MVFESDPIARQLIERRCCFCNPAVGADMSPQIVRDHEDDVRAFAHCALDAAVSKGTQLRIEAGAGVSGYVRE